MRKSTKRAVAAFAVAATVMVACSTDSEPSTQVLGTSVTRDRAAELDAVVDAVDDSSFPEVTPQAPTGIYGFSRYVWTDSSSGVVPFLVEGPQGKQQRCQDPDLPCSYQDLRALAATDDDPPPELGMTRAELEELVGQLDELNGFLSTFSTMDDACAAGYAPETEQNPNMGIHMSQPSMLADGFDPTAPEMLLWAKPDGELIPRAELGECDENGQWTGGDGYQIVGAAFLLAMTPEHPEAFAGPIDNWHIHYSACNGAESDAIQGDEQSCVEAGGQFFEKTPVWMMHAYVADGFDNQLGVFAMFNDTIWPLGQDLSLGNQQVTPSESGVSAPIVNFDFGDDLRVAAGETVTFSNSDSLPHTVTAGLPGAASDDFDSGVLGAGDSFTAEFDEAGEYRFFCSLHPQMTATIVVD